MIGITVKIIEEFSEELKAASKPLIHPHIDGVTAVILARVKRGESIKGEPITTLTLAMHEEKK